MADDSEDKFEFQFPKREEFIGKLREDQLQDFQSPEIRKMFCAMDAHEQWTHACFEIFVRKVEDLFRERAARRRERRWFERILVMVVSSTIAVLIGRWLK